MTDLKKLTQALRKRKSAVRRDGSIAQSEATVITPVRHLSALSTSPGSSPSGSPSSSCDSSGGF